jgi:hypothetical protein
MNAKQGSNLIFDVIAKLEKEGKTGEYMKDYVKALKSFFDHNGVHITQRFRVPRATHSTKVSQEQSPTPDQLRKVLNAADLKAKVESALVGLAGLRLETLGDYEGKDGLKVKDLPEMEIDSKTKIVSFQKIPSIVQVRTNLSKAGHPYFTFMPDEGCQYLKELLEYRLRSGEELTPNSPVITSLKFRNQKHIMTTNISDSIRVPIRKAGFDWRPYILRTYFDTRLMMAEADGLIIRDWRAFWMGHKGDIEHVYTLNKRLPEDVIEQMREAFAKAAEKYLITAVSKETMSKDAVVATFNRQFLSLAGYSDAEIDQIGDLSKLAAEEIQELVKRKSREALGLAGNNRQKVIPMPEVRTWIMQGWEYVSALPNDEAIVRLPL